MLQHVCSEPRSFLHFTVVNAVTAIDIHVNKMAIPLASVLEGEVKHFEGDLEGVVPWNFVLLPQYSVISSVVFEINYKLIIK